MIASTPANTNIETLFGPQAEPSAVLERVKKEADLIDIRFKDEFKVCTYRLEDILIEVKQHRRHLEDLAVAILGPVVS